MADAEPGGSTTARNVGVGCFTAFAGFWSGGMIAVLVAKLVGAVRGCPSSDYGAPCDWTAYAAVGMVAGAISLPVLALMRLRRRDAARNSARG